MMVVMLYATYSAGLLRFRPQHAVNYHSSDSVCLSMQMRSTSLKAPCLGMNE